MIHRALRHLYRSARLELAPAAALERDERARLYPERIRAGQIERGDAEADFQAWAAIAAWLAGEAEADPEITFAAMELAASRALQTAAEAVDSSPAEKRAARTARRDKLSEILELVRGHRDWLADINAELRGRSARKAEAA